MSHKRKKSPKISPPKTLCFLVENLIRGLDDDEVDFLDVIDKAKSVAERKQQLEEQNEMQDFRQQVASIQETILDKVSVELK